MSDANNDGEVTNADQAPKEKKKGGRPKKGDDGTKGVWVLKNISNETKAAVKKAATANNEYIGDYCNRVLLEVSQQEITKTRAVGKTADQMSQQNIDLLAALAEKVDRLEKQYKKPFLSRIFGG
jgi:hypothetical protein